MSITRSEWSKADDDNRKVDVAMLNDRYFNTDDGYIWRVDDFIMIQGPETTRHIEGHGTSLGYDQSEHGLVRWNVILKREGDEDKARLGMILFEFEVSPSYHKVKEPSGKKPVYRGGLGEDVNKAEPARRDSGGPVEKFVDVGQVERNHGRGRAVVMGQGHHDVEGVDWESQNGKRVSLRTPPEKNPSQRVEVVQYPRDAIDAG